MPLVMCTKPISPEHKQIITACHEIASHFSPVKNGFSLQSADTEKYQNVNTICASRLMRYYVHLNKVIIISDHETIITVSIPHVRVIIS